MKTPGWRASFSIEATKYWFTDTAESLDSESIGTIWVQGRHAPYVNTYFVSIDKIEKVTDTLKRFGGSVTIAKGPIRGGPSGTIVRFESKRNDKLVERLANVPGRVTLHARPGEPGKLIVIVELPKFDPSERNSFEKLGRSIERIPNITLTEKPKVESVMLDTAEFIDVKDVSPPNEAIDEKDKEIALELFRVGYYDPSKKDKVKLESIAENVGLSKPTLIKRKKRLEAIGLSTILSTRIPEDEMKMAADLLGSMIRPKRPSKSSVPS